LVKPIVHQLKIEADNSMLLCMHIFSLHGITGRTVQRAMSGKLYPKMQCA